MSEEKELDRLLPDYDILGGFLAMWHGCISPATIFPNGRFFCGKFECELIWPAGWEKLKELGLIDYHIEDVQCFDGSIMKKVHLIITERGEKLRNDYRAR